MGLFIRITVAGERGPIISIETAGFWILRLAVMFLYLIFRTDGL
jgi:hypothetical protein